MTATPTTSPHLDLSGDPRDVARPPETPHERAPETPGRLSRDLGEPRPAVVSVDVLSRSTMSRRGIRAMLGDHPDRVVPATAAAGRADVVLFELSANAVGDQRALRYLSRQPAAVIVIAHAGHPEAISRALELGASCCVTTEISSAALVTCICRTAEDAFGPSPAAVRQAGGSPDSARPSTDPRITSAGARPRRPRPAPMADPSSLREEAWTRAPELGSRLSDREQEVISLIATGLSNTEIAELLHLGLNTVKTYIRAAYRKIGVRTRTQAVIWAINQAAQAEGVETTTSR